MMGEFKAVFCNSSKCLGTTPVHPPVRDVFFSRASRVVNPRRQDT